MGGSGVQGYVVAGSCQVGVPVFVYVVYFNGGFSSEEKEEDPPKHCSE